MKNVVFFTEPEWAFGAIHYDLAKYLFQYGYNCQLLSWKKGYTVQEMIELDTVTDLYLTNPHGYRYLVHNFARVRPNKVVVVTHGKLDLDDLINHHGYDDFDRFRRFAGVSKWMSDVAKSKGVKREMEIAPLGINYQSFYSSPSLELRTVGYAGAYTANNVHHGVKRVHLIEQAVHKAGLALKASQSYNNTFITMPGFYRSVDAVIIASSEESAGLPALEAGASGKLVITTPVGHYNSRITSLGADCVPIDENQFVEQTAALLIKYKEDRNLYTKRCLEIQSHAKTYDWHYVIDRWIDLLK